MVSIGRGSADRAREMLLEVLAIADEIGSKPAGQSLLEVAAGLAASRDGVGTAPRASSARRRRRRARRGFIATRPTRHFLAPLIAQAREALGAAAFAAAEAAGRALTYEVAMARRARGSLATPDRAPVPAARRCGGQPRAATLLGYSLMIQGSSGFGVPGPVRLIVYLYVLPLVECLSSQT